MKVEFAAFPKAFTGNVAVFVAADKQLLASAQAIDKDVGGAIVRAIGASRFTGAKGQSLTVLGQSGGIARLSLLGVGKSRELDARAAEALGGTVAAEANASGQQMQGADAALHDGAVALADFILDVAGGEDWLVEVPELGLVEASFDSALASLQLTSYFGVHSKLLFLRPEVE